MIIGKDEDHGGMLFLTHSKIMIGVFWLTQHIALSPSINYPFTWQETGKKLNMWNLVRYCEGLEATDKICWLVSLIYCQQTLVYLSESPRSLAENERFLIFIFNLFHKSVGWASEKIFSGWCWHGNPKTVEWKSLQQSMLVCFLILILNNLEICH